MFHFIYGIYADIQYMNCVARILFCYYVTTHITYMVEHLPFLFVTLTYTGSRYNSYHQCQIRKDCSQAN